MLLFRLAVMIIGVLKPVRNWNISVVLLIVQIVFFGFFLLLNPPSAILLLRLLKIMAMITLKWYPFPQTVFILPPVGIALLQNNFNFALVFYHKIIGLLAAFW